MSSYISSNANRFYTALESSYGSVGAITASNRIPALKLTVRQQLDVTSRKDKTGSRTFALSKGEIRSSVILTEVPGGTKPLRAGARTAMAQEIEIKLRITDAKALHRTLKRLGARPVDGGSGRVHEWNVIFDTPEGGLAKHGQLLRIRIETVETKSKKRKTASAKRTLLTFKRPILAGATPSASARENHRHKVREEVEVEVADASVLAKIFEGLGMRGWFRYEKYRTTFRLPAARELGEGVADRIG